MTISFRALEAEELPAVHVLNEAAVPAVSSVSLAQLRALEAMATQFVLAYQDQTLAGFLILLEPGAAYESVNYRWFSKRYERFLYIDRIVIDPRFHRQGIASSFYAGAWQNAQRQSVALTCEVNIVPPNPQSMAFHRTLGFTQVGRLHSADGDKLVALLVREPSCS